MVLESQVITHDVVEKDETVHSIISQQSDPEFVCHSQLKAEVLQLVPLMISFKSQSPLN